MKYVFVIKDINLMKRKNEGFSGLLSERSLSRIFNVHVQPSLLEYASF